MHSGFTQMLWITPKLSVNSNSATAMVVVLVEAEWLPYTLRNSLLIFQWQPLEQARRNFDEHDRIAWLWLSLFRCHGCG